MPIDIMKSAVSVGVGVADEMLEMSDMSADRTEPFQKWSDLGRLLGAGVGYAMQVFWPQQQRIGEAIALSATPLLVKSLARPIREAMQKEGEPSSAFTPRRVPAGMGQVTQSHGTPVRSYPSPRKEAEFAGIRIT